MTETLDGTYQVSSTSNYTGPLERRSDGTTVIQNGKTERRDGNHVLWTSTFTVLSENEVEMASLADPSEAAPDFALLRPNGSPTREPVSYRSVLKLSRKGDQVQMSGQIQYGNEIVFVTLRRVSA